MDWTEETVLHRVSLHVIEKTGTTMRLTPNRTAALLPEEFVKDGLDGPQADICDEQAR